MLELKSLKSCICNSFCNEGIFYEHATNRILDDLVAAPPAPWITLRVSHSPLRGGITTSVTATHEAPQHHHAKR